MSVQFGMADHQPCCGNCRYFLQNLPNGEGACRRYPPSALAIGQGMNGFFPPVKPSIWCGEHQPLGGLAS